jgi:DNA repair exonuclease SbcCD nuclease subunit
MINNSKVAVFSDLHLGVHNNSNQWHDIALNWCKWFVAELRQKQITDIIFCGDWYHNRSEISVDTLNVSAEIFDMLKEFNLVIITGNHDLYFKHRTDVHSLNLMKGRHNVTIIDTPRSVECFGKTLSFLPWGFDVNSVSNGDICFGHLEVESFQMNSSKTCDDGIKASSLLQKFGLTLSGHFHTRHERMFGAGTILYVGNPFEMDFGDCDNVKGYYVLDLKDLSYEFTLNNISPKYKKITLSEMVAAGTITSDIKMQITNNFVKLKIDRNINQDDVSTLYTVINQLAPNSITVDYDLNYNKILTDNNSYDFSGIDIPNAILEFVNLLDVDEKDSIIKYTLNLYKKCTNA